MNHDDVTLLGQIDYRNDKRLFGIKRGDRRYHMLLIGRTGAGKSTFLAQLIRQDVANGEGLAVLDPHGDLANAARESIPPARAHDVILFDPADPANALTFNPLHVQNFDQRHLVVSELMTIFQQIWEKSWGPRLEYILRVTLLTLTSRPGYTLLDALRMLNDAEFRAGVVAGLQDEILKAFWSDEFGRYSKSHRTEAIAPIQNKLGEFLINPILRRVFDHPEGSIQLRSIMDEGKVLIVNLSVGRLGRDVSRLLGASLLGKLALAALSRADQPANERRDFYAYVDEFPLFATSSVDTILSEARKYGLALVVALQYLDALEPKLVAAILGNVGNLLVFRVGVKDAVVLEKELTPAFSRDDLVNVPHHHMYVRLMIDHKPARPFSGRLVTNPGVEILPSA